MAKFEFRLETLQKLRKAARDRRRAELAEANEAGRILDDQRKALESDIQALRQSATESMRTGMINVDSLLGEHRYELVLRSQQRVIDQQKTQIETEIERRREVLMEADRQVQVLEKLREKQLQQHRIEEQKQEMKSLEDLAEGRWGRREGSIWEG